MSINCINNASTEFTFDNITILGNTIEPTTGNLIFATDGSNNIELRNLTQTLMNVTFDGNVTLPLQPGFLVYQSTDITNQTGAGATVTVSFNTEAFDTTSNFSSGTTFTALATGMYLFSFLISYTNVSSNMDVGKVRLVTSNRTYLFELDAFNTCANGSIGGITGSVIADMDVSDTATITLTIEDGTTNTATISGSISEMVTFFSGYLIA